MKIILFITSVFIIFQAYGIENKNTSQNIYIDGRTTNLVDSSGKMLSRKEARKALIIRNKTPFNIVIKNVNTKLLTDTSYITPFNYYTSETPELLAKIEKLYDTNPSIKGSNNEKVNPEDSLEFNKIKTLIDTTKLIADSIVEIIKKSSIKHENTKINLIDYLINKTTPITTTDNIDNYNFNALYNKYINRYNSLQNWIYLDNYIEGSINYFISDKTKYKENIETKVKSLSTEQINLNDIPIKGIEFISDLNQIYPELLKLYSNIKISIIDSTNDIFQKMELLKIAHKKISASGKSNEILKLINTGVGRINELLDDNNYTIYQPTSTFKDDEKDVLIELKNRDGKIIKSYGPYTVINKGKTKINFSTGYFLSFPFKQHEEFNYAFDTTGTTIIGIKSSNKKEILSHSFGVLLNCYWLTGYNFNIGGSVGLSISTETNVNFHGGLTVFFTEKDRIAFTIGMSLVKVQQLNSKNLIKVENNDILKEKADYKFTSANTDITYNKYYRPALFCAFTFNLMSLIKK